MPCVHEAASAAVLLSSPAVLAALVVYFVKKRRTSPVLSAEEVETLLEKAPLNSHTEYVEKTSLLQSQEWMPPNHYDGNAWVTRILAEAETSSAPLHPVLKEFQATIEDDPILFMLFTRMFSEVPEANDPTGRPQVKDYMHMVSGQAH